MRLAGQEKMGFYPTPRCVAEEIRGILKIDKGARILDPCCGEGSSLWTVIADEALEEAYGSYAQATIDAMDALGKDVTLSIDEGREAELDTPAAKNLLREKEIFRRKLAEYPGTYGIELDRDRARIARRKLGCFLNCDALSEARVSRGGFGLLWLNPPYDLEQGDVTDTRQRLELKFLRRYFPALQQGGVLVYLVPWSILSKAGRFLANRLGGLGVFSFPADEYDAYKQVLVIGVNRLVGREEIDRNRKLLAKLSSVPESQVPEMVPVVGGSEFRKLALTVPKSLTPESELIFKSTRIDPDEAYQVIRKDGLYDLFVSENVPREMNRIRPLTALRQGHLAMLLASGMMNGEVEKDGKKYLIKGSVRKVVNRSETVTEESEDSEKSRIVETDRFQIMVKMLDFEARVIREIQ